MKVRDSTICCSPLRVSWLWILPLIKPCHYYHHHHHGFLMFWFIVIFCNRSQPSVMGAFGEKALSLITGCQNTTQSRPVKCQKNYPNIFLQKNAEKNDKHFAAFTHQNLNIKKVGWIRPSVTKSVCNEK